MAEDIPPRRAPTGRRALGIGVGLAALMLGTGAALAFRPTRRELEPLPRPEPTLPPPIPGSTMPEVNSEISESDRRLLAQDFTNRDAEAVARMIASENPSATEQAHVEQVWTQLRSQKKTETLYDRITAGEGYGPQIAPRPVASGKAPTTAQLELAWDVLRGKKLSVLPGAKKFFDPDQEDKVYAQVTKGRADLAAGKPITKRTAELIAAKYHRTAEQVRQKWTREGTKEVGTIGPVEFWT